ncbi:MAG: hypothetical protein ABSE49_26315 [Polyangiaceae bacterium]|jgi:hypothetical protein
MNLPRLPVLFGVAAIAATLAGCAEAPVVPPQAAPHPIVGFGIDREATRPSRNDAPSRADRFVFVPRFDSFMWIARRHH